VTSAAPMAQNFDQTDRMGPLFPAGYPALENFAKLPKNAIDDESGWGILTIPHEINNRGGG
jgi:hypothetical protein